MVVMNASIPLPFNNLNNYTIDILSCSYGASWTAITNLLGSNATPLHTNVAVSVHVSQARVLHWRLYVWIGLNMQVTLSGLCFIVIQMTCSKPLVVDTAVAALLLDTRDVVHKHQRGLCNLSMLTKDDSAISSLRLRWQGGHAAVVAADDGVTPGRD